VRLAPNIRGAANTNRQGGFERSFEPRGRGAARLKWACSSLLVVLAKRLGLR
jgi:hypothetical protein